MLVDLFKLLLAKRGDHKQTQGDLADRIFNVQRKKTLNVEIWSNHYMKLYKVYILFSSSQCAISNSFCSHCTFHVFENKQT